jgi:TrmH family RNA methyltransferase
MAENISSRNNPLIREIRSLHQHKTRKETRKFLIEGIHHVGEAIQAGWEIESLVYSPDLLTSDFGLNQVEVLSQRGIRCFPMAKTLFVSLASKDNPQGILAVAKQREHTLETISSAHVNWGAACVSPQDPGNVGTILRTLDAVGADVLFLLDGGVELYNPTLVRSSMGSLFWKSVVQCSFPDFIEWAHEYDFRLVGSSAHAELDFRKVKQVDQPTVILLGNEQKGLTKDQMAACDEVVSIPMKGRGSSLNLAVAAGILLFALKRSLKD